MEDGSLLPSETPSEITENGLGPSRMDSNPLVEDAVESDDKNNLNINGDGYSSESDALVIDESVPVRKKKKKNNNEKKIEQQQQLVHYNPYFNESLFELSQQHHQTNTINESANNSIEEPSPSATNITTSTTSSPTITATSGSKRLKSKHNPKLREYAQYLGLQPTVQFKCWRCGRAGFESLTTLNEHVVQCTDEPPAQQPPPATTDSSSSTTTAPSSTFKLTRKVFLCSACGTYYENWNLYLHMIEVHRRYLCLYCLGMFSVLDDLCLHIQSRHNFEPGHKDSIDDFFSVYRDPCFIVCVECKKLFSEQDNFFYHSCARKTNSISNATNNKIQANHKVITKVKQIRPEDHITGDSTSTATSKTTNIKQPEAISTTNGNVDLLNSLQQELPSDTTIELSTTSNVNETILNDRSDVNYDINYSSDEEHCLFYLKGFDQLGEGVFLHKDTNNLVKKSIDILPQTSPSPPSEDEAENQQQQLPKSLLHEDLSDVEEEEEEIVAEEEIDDEEEEVEDEAEDEEEEEEEMDEPKNKEAEIVVETRKVPKLSLKLNVGSFPTITSESRDVDDEPEEEEEQQQNQQQDDEEEEIEEEKDDEEMTNQDHIDDDENKQTEINEEDKSQEDNSEEKQNEIDIIENENTDAAEQELSTSPDKQEQPQQPEMKIAGEEISIIELELEQPLDKFDIRILLQKCLKATAPLCIYCNHARKIAVNGKQLGLHAIGEHRFSAVVHSITAEELIPESFVTRIKDALPELENVFFSLESSTTDEAITFSHQFECFQCRYSTSIHKELYLHNRKLHAKNLLLCIMCKCNFYSYSELICHMCPGVYIIDYDVSFRCCMCVSSDDLPSAFRLMVHLRKRHHVCDVCLEMCHSQYRLSNHVWKHKLHHFCYRCGIAYRNKPDITRHLFWKHGTESVLCKKCLQKKWPHVYHFCVPPLSFPCDECTLAFGRAVSLKVHKRIHSDVKPHQCTFDECNESFISKKLLLKHENKHREPEKLPSPPPLPASITNDDDANEKSAEKSMEGVEEMGKIEQEGKENEGEVKGDEEAAISQPPPPPPIKPKVDVYDLPELNLSESDSSSDEEEKEEKKNVSSAPPTLEESELVEEMLTEEVPLNNSMLNENVSIVNEVNENQTAVGEEQEDVVQPPLILENIWDNFKTYQANKEKFDNLLTEVSDQQETNQSEERKEDDEPLSVEVALHDHDYCVETEIKHDVSFTEVKPDLSQSVDHDYCTSTDKIKDDLNDASGSSKIDSEDKSVKAKDESATINADKNAKNISGQPNNNNNNSSSSDSSSDSNSSCSCGPNCSCSSSSDSGSSSSSESSNSDSSTEEGRKRQQLRRDRRRQKKQQKRGGDKKQSISNENNRKMAQQQQQEQATSAMKTATNNESTSAAPSSTMLLNVAEMPICESDLETTESDTDEEFYDKQPQQFAKKILEEKRNALLAGIQTPNGANSRAATPNLPEVVEEEQQQQQEIQSKSSKKKSKSKKKKKRKSERKESEMYKNNRFLHDVHHHQQQYYYHQQPQQLIQPTVAPLTLTLTRNSPVASPSSNNKIKDFFDGTPTSAQENDSNLRASKRRRVPNKFYGYSSDEEDEKSASTPKWRKAEPQHHVHSQQLGTPSNYHVHQPQQQLVVPPITIKTTPTMPIRAPPTPQARLPPIKLKTTPMQQHYQQQQQSMSTRVDVEGESEADESNDSSNEGRNMLQVNPDALYCYCKCPYDEVSEMIGCDSRDCSIEWFHFECVGIMVPPKGHWYCPECRKKRQQKREMLKMKSKMNVA